MQRHVTEIHCLRVHGGLNYIARYARLLEGCGSNLLPHSIELCSAQGWVLPGLFTCRGSDGRMLLERATRASAVPISNVRIKGTRNIQLFLHLALSDLGEFGSSLYTPVRSHIGRRRQHQLEPTLLVQCVSPCHDTRTSAEYYY